LKESGSVTPLNTITGKRRRRIGWAGLRYPQQSKGEQTKLAGGRGCQVMNEAKKLQAN